MSVESLFLSASVDYLRQHTSRIENCLARLTHEQIWMRGAPHENAIGNLVLHLNGNVGQWILSTLGGATDQRERDAEFAANGGVDAPALRSLISGTIGKACGIVSGLNTAQLIAEYDIQGYHVSGVKLVLHVVEHFAQHTAQIVFATKRLTGADLGFYRHLKATGHDLPTP